MSEFRTSSFCQDGGCVAVAVAEKTVSVRDEKNPAAGSFTVSREAWTVFLAALPAGTREA